MDNQKFCSLFEACLTVERRASIYTIIAYRTDLAQFVDYLSGFVPQKMLTEVTALDLRGWVMSLAKKGLSPCSINRKIASIRAFYIFLQKRKLIETSPAQQLKMLKGKKSLPIFFQEKELLSFLSQYEFAPSFSGLRDKLVLELLYGTGMRLAELLALCTKDINLVDGTLKVLGKRNKERIIPFPRPLKQLIETYLLQRAELVCILTTKLIITDHGKPCYPMFIYRIVKRYLLSATRASQHSPHILRHTFATHLLDKGADLQSIKELLGHRNLAATQVYTHNSLTKLKEVFKKAHPRAEEKI